MVFQFFNLLDDLTVADNVMLPAQLAGMARGAAQRRAAELLGALGIDRHARAYPGRLSGGERQRVAVARALMNRPALLLADEPTGALDTASGEDVQQLLNDLHADGQTIVLVTHDLALAESCATRTVQLVDGRVAADTAARRGGPDERAGQGRPLRGGAAPGADGRDRAGRDDRGDRGRARRIADGGLAARRSTGPSPSSSGAHLTAQFDAAKATAAQLSASAQATGVTAAAGPFPTAVIAPVDGRDRPLHADDGGRAGRSGRTRRRRHR